VYIDDLRSHQVSEKEDGNLGSMGIDGTERNMGQSLYLCSSIAGFRLLGTRQGPALSSCKSMGRHCADNNAGAQRYLFSGRFQITGDRGTQRLRAS